MKPVAKKATAAELREAFVAMMCGRRDCSCSTVRDIDAIIAAVRAEALATRQSEIDELVADFQRLHAKYKVKAAPLPRAVRELLRDVVKLDYDEESPFTRMVDGWVVPSLDAMAKRAARILGTTPAAIVARARKVRK